MQIQLKAASLRAVTLSISGSKSESNRLLLLQALFPQLRIGNLSDSDDTQTMKNGLSTTSDVFDVHHAGTAMRFLTTFFASLPGREITLTGSARMCERPIKLLVDALLELGAEISYPGEHGYPPIRIAGRKLSGGQVTLPANVSSQYISALALIAPRLDAGLKIRLEGEITSVPYIKMTVALLRQTGIDAEFVANTVTIQPAAANIASINNELRVESDWSSASYFYSLVCLAEPGYELELHTYKNDSLQGDRALVEIYRRLGVQTRFTGSSIVLKRLPQHAAGALRLDLNDTPDIAQTVAVSCLGLGIDCDLGGLHTLKIKETDRLAAMKTELEKFGAHVIIENDRLLSKAALTLPNGIIVKTYNDHRMAMAFAPLALKCCLVIDEPAVVSKSYPRFWDDLALLGFEITQI